MPLRNPVRSVAVAVVAAAVVAAGVVGARALAGPSAPSAAMAPPRFVEVARDAGIEHVYDGEWPYFVGGGVAAFDCDDSGLPDLYLAGGAEPAALYRNTSIAGGDLAFAPVDDAEVAMTGVTGAYPLDLDGDGLLDLVVLRDGENVLLRGLGDCRFERANEVFGFDGGDEFTTAFSATWEREDELPTLAFGNYVDATGDSERFGTCHDNVLVRPDSDTGGAYGTPVALSPGWCALSMLFSDWSRSGGTDLRVSNDRHYNLEGEEQLWAISPDDPPRSYTREDGWQRLEIWGMGIASHDLTGDGYPEVFLTSQGDNKLQTLADDPNRPEYEDIAIRRGVTAHRPFTGDDTTMPSTAWHAEFQDVNNDGFVDLFVAKGNVEAQPDHAAADPNNLLLGDADGTFVEVADAAGIASVARARGAALVDFNLDGMLDLVVVNRRENVEVWHNVGWGEAGEAGASAPMGRWLAIRLSQSGANRDAIGAWIEVRIGDHTIRRELTVGGGHAGGQLGWVHVGLGDARRADVRITWPDGEAGDWERVDAGTRVVLERGGSGPQVWQPPGA